jgi:hypothetical protein
MIRFFIVPDMLQNAPMYGIHLLSVCEDRLTPILGTRFKRVGPNAMKGRGIGTARGRATIMRGEFYKHPVSPRQNYMHFSSKWFVDIKAYHSREAAALRYDSSIARRGRGQMQQQRGIRR